jgi:enoyl-[acyl-carrier protein] reductase II
MDIILTEGVKIVFTSAGNPGAWTKLLKSYGIKVAHVVSSLRFARKAEDAGVDAVVAEGFEAGGHNGREETTTFCLIPMMRELIDLPLIAAGGIADGRTMSGALALGADAVQIGTRFAVSLESSAHPAYKEYVLKAGEGDTELVLKALHPVRLLKNTFYQQIRKAEEQGATAEMLREKLGKGRSRTGIFEGDLENGELEAGQISAVVHEIKPAGDIVKEIWSSFWEHRSAYIDRTRTWAN